jgi:hypothetical protein
MNGNMKTALTALTDALAELPAEDILFTWFRSGRLVGELHELLEQRHPLKLGEMDRVYRYEMPGGLVRTTPCNDQKNRTSSGKPLRS